MNRLHGVHAVVVDRCEGRVVRVYFDNETNGLSVVQAVERLERDFGFTPAAGRDLVDSSLTFGSSRGFYAVGRVVDDEFTNIPAGAL